MKRFAVGVQPLASSHLVTQVRLTELGIEPMIILATTANMDIRMDAQRAEIKQEVLLTEHNPV